MIITGVSNVVADLPTQRVFVDSDLSSDDLLAVIKKTGKVEMMTMMTMVMIRTFTLIPFCLIAGLQLRRRQAVEGVVDVRRRSQRLYFMILDEQTGKCNSPESKILLNYFFHIDPRIPQCQFVIIEPTATPAATMKR